MDSIIKPKIPLPVPAFFTTRSGGVSDPPYHSLNLSVNVNDESEVVSENRLRIAHLLPNEPRWLRQAHGARVLRAENIKNTNVDIADASYSTTPGVVCAVLTADCAPVLLCDEGGDCVAAVHAGWRGLAAGIIENAVTALTTFSTGDLIACIGPTISAAHYEVGDDVHRALCVTDDDKAHFTPTDNGKWYADLPALVSRRLAAGGVKKIHNMAECTYSSPQTYYSARRNKITGRMAALIWIPTEAH